MVDARPPTDPASAERLAAPLVAALHRCAAEANGPDWREQSWDSYRYDHYEREVWSVTVPFAALTRARSAVVPVAAAERLLALPDQPRGELWERPQSGRAYRPYWTRDKRFLVTVAEIAARWPAEGEHLVSELRRLLRRLPPRESHPVALACAALGLTDDDPLRAALTVLDSAADDELGARGELVLQMLHSSSGLDADQRAHLLRQATAVARRTTAFVASNPFAACVEALAGAEIDSSGELLELVERAVRVKLLEWDGWQTALHAAGRATTRLAACHGATAVNEVVAGLGRWERWLPGLVPWLLAAGARGLSGAEQSVCLLRALRAARRAEPSTYSLRAEAAAVRLLAEAKAEGAADELAFTLRRLTAMPTGAARQLGLLAAVGERAALGADHWQSAAALAERLPPNQAGWLAMALLAGSAGPAEDRQRAFDAARRRARRLRPLRPPFDVLAPLWLRLAELGDSCAPALAHVAELGRQASLHERPASEFAGALMALGPQLAEPAALRVVADLASELRWSWWRLPLLALLGDAAGDWLRGHLV